MLKLSAFLLLLLLLGSIQPGPSQAVDTSDLAAILKELSTTIFPPLQNISSSIWHKPELALEEFHAHELVTSYFEAHAPGWTVTPGAYGLETAFALDFVHVPPGHDPAAPVPAVGFFAEYDALTGIGHACGHNQIALNGLAAARLAAAALVRLGAAGRVRLVGTPDEENGAGKARLLRAGAFGPARVWLMAHPTAGSTVNPMNARLNLVASFAGASHADAVRAAFEALVLVRDLAGGGGGPLLLLPGTASTVTAVEDVGLFASNVVQQVIRLGVAGADESVVDGTVAGLLDDSYPGVNYTLAAGAHGGVDITILGPGGHASESTKTPLVLATETFRALTAAAAAGGEGLSWYLPGNTSVAELDITFDLRTRYTADIDALFDTVLGAIKSRIAGYSTDTIYPALELTPVLPGWWVDLMATDAYGLDDWAVKPGYAPASTDASWVQGAQLDPETRELLGASAVVFHPNFNICGPGGPCAFNHEPGFAAVANTDFAYAQTEVVARGQAHLAVELMTNPDFWSDVTAIVR